MMKNWEINGTDEIGLVKPTQSDKPQPNASRAYRPEAPFTWFNFNPSMDK